MAFRGDSLHVTCDFVASHGPAEAGGLFCFFRCFLLSHEAVHKFVFFSRPSELVILESGDSLRIVSALFGGLKPEVTVGSEKGSWWHRMHRGRGV